MNIIEREILKRQELISSQADKLNRAFELEAEAMQLRAEANAIDVQLLTIEIAELESYLQKSTESQEQEQEKGTEQAVDGTGAII